MLRLQPAFELLHLFDVSKDFPGLISSSWLAPRGSGQMSTLPRRDSVAALSILGAIAGSQLGTKKLFFTDVDPSNGWRNQLVHAHVCIAKKIKYTVYTHFASSCC